MSLASGGVISLCSAASIKGRDENLMRSRLREAAARLSVEELVERRSGLIAEMNVTQGC